MDQSVSAAEANCSFSRLLRDVRAGRSFVITAHGKPVARIVPCTEADADQKAARMALFKRLSSQPVVDIGRWSRDELYER